MAYSYVSTEMDVLLPIRVFLKVQGWIEVTQVAVLTVCEAKSNPGSPGCLFTHDSVPL